MTLFRKSRSKGDLQQEFQTTVRFLDDSEPIQLPFTKETLGQFVLDKVCDSLNLVEKDYFGLRYVDADKQRHWLDPTKTVYKQLKGVSPCVLCFRVKFYPADPMKLHEEITRYYLFLQLRRDLHHGRLLCSPQDANLLAAYIIQSEVGDYDPQDHPPGYVAEFKMLPSQNVQQEQQIQEIHKTLVSKSRNVCKLCTKGLKVTKGMSSIHRSGPHRRSVKAALSRSRSQEVTQVGTKQVKDKESGSNLRLSGQFPGNSVPSRSRSQELSKVRTNQVNEEGSGSNLRLSGQFPGNSVPSRSRSQEVSKVRTNRVKVVGSASNLRHSGQFPGNSVPSRSKSQEVSKVRTNQVKDIRSASNLGHSGQFPGNSVPSRSRSQEVSKVRTNLVKGNDTGSVSSLHHSSQGPGNSVALRSRSQEVSKVRTNQVKDTKDSGSVSSLHHSDQRSSVKSYRTKSQDMSQVGPKTAKDTGSVSSLHQSSQGPKRNAHPKPTRSKPRPVSQISSNQDKVTGSVSSLHQSGQGRKNSVQSVPSKSRSQEVSHVGTNKVKAAGSLSNLHRPGSMSSLHRQVPRRSVKSVPSRSMSEVASQVSTKVTGSLSNLHRPGSVSSLHRGGTTRSSVKSVQSKSRSHEVSQVRTKVAKVTGSLSNLHRTASVTSLHRRGPRSSVKSKSKSQEVSQISATKAKPSQHQPAKPPRAVKSVPSRSQSQDMSQVSAIQVKASGNVSNLHRPGSVSSLHSQRQPPGSSVKSVQSRSQEVYQVGASNAQVKGSNVKITGSVPNMHNPSQGRRRNVKSVPSRSKSQEVYQIRTSKVKVTESVSTMYCKHYRRGQVPAEAEANFLKKASSLDTYGVDPHKVKDQKGNQMYLGVTHQGIMTFHGSRRTQIYKWSQIKKLAFEGKTFIAHVNINEDGEQTSSKKKHQPIGYKCLTVSACKYLWRCAVEQQFFFTLQNSFNTPKVRSGGSLFSRGSKFRFSGRCQNEAYIASEDIKRKEPDFQRTCSLPNFARKSDSRLHARNSANMAISEGRRSQMYIKNKGGKGYKAETLPRMTSAPSVSAEPPKPRDKQAESSGGSGKKRHSSSGSKGNKRDSRELNEVPIKVDNTGEVKVKLAPKASVENVDIDSSKESLTAAPSVAPVKPLRSESSSVKNKPKLKEIARQSSKEVIKYTEVEQRQSYLEREPAVVQTMSETVTVEKSAHVEKPAREVTTVVDEHGISRKENAVDVPRSSILADKTPKAGEDMIVAEEMTQVKAGLAHAEYPDMRKQNGGIPIIVTTPSSPDVTSRDDSSLPYDPEETVYDQEDDEKIAKSLEEQVMDLEKEFQDMQDKNHIDSRVNPSGDSSVNQPANSKAVAAKKGGCSCGKIVAYTFFSLFLTLTVSACVVMFSDIDHPVMNEARNHLTFLEPTRDFIRDQINNLMKKVK